MADARGPEHDTTTSDRLIVSLMAAFQSGDVDASAKAIADLVRENERLRAALASTATPGRVRSDEPPMFDLTPGGMLWLDGEVVAQVLPRDEDGAVLDDIRDAFAARAAAGRATADTDPPPPGLVASARTPGTFLGVIDDVPSEGWEVRLYADPKPWTTPKHVYSGAYVEARRASGDNPAEPERSGREVLNEALCQEVGLDPQRNDLVQAISDAEDAAGAAGVQPEPDDGPPFKKDDRVQIGDEPPGTVLACETTTYVKVAWDDAAGGPPEWLDLSNEYASGLRLVSGDGSET